jgi:hypothetical protein
MFLHAGASVANFWHYYPDHSMSKLTTDKTIGKKQIKHLRIASG